jgi:polar amino acid transport system substrate-binding protein
VDVDLANALAAVMGLKLHVAVNQSVTGVLNGVTSGVYDLGASSLPDLPSRNRAVNLTHYLQHTGLFFARASGGARVSGLDALCGRSVSAVVLSIGDLNALGQSKKCVQSHRSPVVVFTTPDQKHADQLLASGRVQLSLADTYDAEQQVAQSNGAFVIASPPYRGFYYALATGKHSHLDRALVVALKILIDRGTYKSILAKWGVQSEALQAPAVTTKRAR